VIVLGMIYLIKLNSKKKAEEQKSDDNYKYVNEETIQSLVFIVYIAYKKGLALLKDIILVKDLFLTGIVFFVFDNRLGFYDFGCCFIHELCLFW